MCDGPAQYMVCVLFFLSESEGEESYYVGRKLQSNGSSSSHGAAWEQCDFEKKHSRYAFLAPYILAIFFLFIGKLPLTPLIISPYECTLSSRFSPTIHVFS